MAATKWIECARCGRVVAHVRAAAATAYTPVRHNDKPRNGTACSGEPKGAIELTIEVLEIVKEERALVDRIITHYLDSTTEATQLIRAWNEVMNRGTKSIQRASAALNRETDLMLQKKKQQQKADR